MLHILITNKIFIYTYLDYFDKMIKVMRLKTSLSL